MWSFQPHFLPEPTANTAAKKKRKRFAKELKFNNLATERTAKKASLRQAAMIFSQCAWCSRWLMWRGYFVFIPKKKGMPVTASL